jgi:hypothetical protein
MHSQRVHLATKGDQAMQNTMELLDKALDMHPAPWWHKKLNLSRNALHNAKIRGNVSPAIAGALAEELGEPVEKWIVIAALESERESACKSRMVRKFITGAALAGTLMGTAGAATATVATPQITESSLYIMLNALCV